MEILIGLIIAVIWHIRSCRLKDELDDN